MARIAVIVLVLTGLVITASTAVPATTGTVVPRTSEDSAILSLDSPATAQFTDQSLDVAATLTNEHDAVESRLDRYALDEALTKIDSDAAKRDRLRAAVDDVEGTAAGLAIAEQNLRLAYANGSISSHVFLRRLTRNTAKAHQLRLTIQRIDERSATVGQVLLRSRLETIDTTLIPLGGPVRTQTAAAQRGDQPTLRVYTAVSTDGIVLAAIRDDGYVREAYRHDFRRPTLQPSIGLDEAVDRANEHYPVAINNSLRTGVGFLQGNVYRIDIQLRDGTVQAFLDGGTGDVFYEIQTRRLQQFTEYPGVSVTDNETRLIVNRTYQGGPLRVATIDNSTDAGRATTVVIDGDRYVTGNDGVLWTIAPAKTFYPVTAVRSTGNTTIIVEAVDARTVNG